MSHDYHLIANYYDNCECDYKRFWDLEQSLALHAGYWDESTNTLREALLRENEILAELVKIKATDHVLDAGCGVGGSAIFLAEKYQCRVTGITLSAKQAEKARQNTHSRHLAHLAEFQTMDFCKTSFSDESFDVVWGLESVCHAENKKHFVEEAFRILKPKGRLIVADGFANECNSLSAFTLMSKWLRGWGVNALETVDHFTGHLKGCGFNQVAFKEITKNIYPSSKKLFYISIPAIFFSILGECLGLRTKIQTANIRSAYYQYKTLKKGLWKYGIFYAEKPE